MPATLLCFSGLPGVGKSTLARQVAQQWHAPLFAIDDVVKALPDLLYRHAETTNPTVDAFWQSMIRIMLKLVEPQLALGINVVIDSVFMGEDRAWAATLAAQHNARYRPVYVYLSDETVWEQRVTQRWEALNRDPDVATWERIQRQRLDFWPWSPTEALFIDSMLPFEANLAKIWAELQTTAP